MLLLLIRHPLRIFWTISESNQMKLFSPLSLHKPLEKGLSVIAWSAYSKFNPRDHFYSKQNAEKF